MNLNNKNICNNYDTLDLVKEDKYEREIRREFYQKPSSDSTRYREGKKRPLRISQWCIRIFNFTFRLMY